MRAFLCCMLLRDCASPIGRLDGVATLLSLGFDDAGPDTCGAAQAAGGLPRQSGLHHNHRALSGRRACVDVRL